MGIFSAYARQYQGLPKSSSMALIAFLFYALSYASIIFLPLYLHISLHQSLPETGVSLAVFGIGTIVAAFFGGKLCDHFPAYLVSKIAIIFYFLFLLFLYFVSGPYWLLLIILVVFGMANAVISPATRIYLMRLTPIADQV